MQKVHLEIVEQNLSTKVGRGGVNIDKLFTNIVLEEMKNESMFNIHENCLKEKSKQIVKENIWDRSICNR